VRPALLLGAATPRWLLVFYGITLALMLTAGALAGKGVLFYVAMVPVGWLLLRQTRGLRLDDPTDCLARFRANRDVGLLVFAALILGGLG
jgi:4-hydroxybenzoate polyprenyltransferase